jgi:threonine dehydrogenase-like Zn-dependent dehydrogenase
MDRRLEVGEVQMPPPGPGEVQVAVGSAGICGSDLHFYRGDFPPQMGRVPGHEIGGFVSAVGAGVRHVREGDLVGVEPLVRCNACRYCVAGGYNQCPNGRALIGVGQDGGMSELVMTPGYTVFPAPGALDAEIVALAEPLACAVHGYGRVALRPDETALIIGAGTIGLTALLAAKAMGASAVIIARHRHQQQAARTLGADEVIADDEAGRTRLDELRGRDTFDVAVETVGGHSETILEAQRSVRRLGRVLVLGVFMVRTVSLDPGKLLQDTSVVGAVTYAAPNGRAEYAEALDLLASRTEVARGLVTHRFRLDDVNQAFATALDKSSGSIKVHVNP